MNYQTFQPHSDLASFIKCYWSLEIPFQKDVQRQLVLPDGCIEMIFILGDDVKRYVSDEEFIIQPREMILGQITEPFYVEPTGCVKSFAVKFYPYGIANFVSNPIKDLANKETPLMHIFGEESSQQMRKRIIKAADTHERINIVEELFLNKLSDATAIDAIVKTTVDSLFLTRGNMSINTLVKHDLSKRRQIERKFKKQIGISPKQLGKVIRLQAALKMLLNQTSESLTEVAYESDYYDQAHFIKDFKEFTGTTPKDFLSDNQMLLSSLFYKES